MAKKRPAHRPSLYDPKYIDEMIEYFSVEPYSVSPSGKRQASDPPTFAGFCARIGTSRHTLFNWCDAHPDFLLAYNKCKEIQEEWFTINGNLGLINPAFAIFTTKNILNWRDKKDIEVTENKSLAEKINQRREKIIK